ncbi:transposase family protein [Solwaraspora sp. WMMA2065]|uniref:transposase family protein n=1 Tax=Solwaraspora sp. WMMA2065 TaxID=3015166 RepID=UPI00259B1A5B|nr:transposase family protein [Solwaraspora sp. WMMA2065]WJK37795.1 transposase family protein [Solwaraspora sp. WMMA2065]
MVSNPRSPRGLRYSLAGLLTVAVCAVMAGASSMTAIAAWLHDLGDITQARLGFVRRAPATATVWRLRHPCQPRPGRLPVVGSHRAPRRRRTRAVVHRRRVYDRDRRLRGLPDPGNRLQASACRACPGSLRPAGGRGRRPAPERRPRP